MPNLKPSDYCQCCGALRGTAHLGNRVSFNELVRIKEYKTLQHGPEKFFEASPQLMVNVNVWRNGGCRDEWYVCADCLSLGLRCARNWLNATLGPETSPWTPVTQSLPDTDRNVLAFAPNNGADSIWLAYWDGARWMDSYGDILLQGVTHWIELPKGPTA